MLAECLLDKRLSDPAELGHTLRPGKAPDGGFCPSCLDETFPLRARLGIGLRQDLDLVTVLKFRGQLTCLAVDANAVAGLADLGMHGIGEINSRGTSWQCDQVTTRRETEYLVVIEVILYLELGNTMELLQNALNTLLKNLTL